MIAVNNGGPTETVVNDSTGLLCEPSPEAFSAAMKTFVDGGEALMTKMGEEGKKRVKNTFSFNAFSGQLDKLVRGE